MKKIFVLMVLVVLASCAVFRDADNNVRNVELGMTEHEVVTIMGRDYKVAGMANTPRGDMRTIRYVTYKMIDGKSYVSAEYFFDFIAGRLVSYHRESVDTRPRHRGN